MKKFLLFIFILGITCFNTVYAQERTVSGTVSSEGDGLPLPGVNVAVAGEDIGGSDRFQWKLLYSGAGR
jgi:hypothetical protein